MNYRACLISIIPVAAAFALGCAQDSSTPLAPSAVGAPALAQGDAPHAGASVTAISTVLGQEARQSFGFRAASISGQPAGGALSLAGGGAYDPTTGFIQAGGSFRCIETVSNGPLNGCEAGQGGHWQGVHLVLPGDAQSQRQFRCVGQQSGEVQKFAVTDDNTLVMHARFYLRGDGGNDGPFITVRMFVSETDEAPDFTGDQKVWVQGVGCGDAIANFN